MKTLVTGLMVAATLFGGIAAGTGSAEAQYYRPHHHWDRGHWDRGGDRGGDAAAAAALGVVGGMIIGGALAQSSRPDYYDDEVVVRRAPRRVYYEDDYAVPRRSVRCRTFIKYDMYGKPYEFKDCDP